MTFLIIAILWLLLGTATYRRVGAWVINKYSRSEKTHLRMCNLKVLGYEHRGCDCGNGPYYPNLELFWFGVLSYLFWAPIAIGYVYANGNRAISRMRGSDWRFFTPAKMIATPAEKRSAYEKAVKELEVNGEVYD